MKNLLTTIALLSSLAAHAETITFTGSGCDANRYCYPQVANNAGVPVMLYANPNSPNFTLYLDGVIYTGQGNSWATTIDSAAVDSLGNRVQVQVVFSHNTTPVIAGRAHYTINHWAIVSGSVTRP